MSSSDDTEDAGDATDDTRSTAEALDLAAMHLARLARERVAICDALGLPVETPDLAAYVVAMRDELRGSRDRAMLSAERARHEVRELRAALLAATNDAADLRAARNATKEEPAMPSDSRPDIDAARRSLRAQIAREERRERDASSREPWRSAIHPDHQAGAGAAWALVEGTLGVGLVGLLAWVIAVVAG